MGSTVSHDDLVAANMFGLVKSRISFSQGLLQYEDTGDDADAGRNREACGSALHYCIFDPFADPFGGDMGSSTACLRQRSTFLNFF